MFYLYEIRDSDGNDCTVYDCIVEADNQDAADESVFSHFNAKDSLESDGDRGYYYDCTCDAPDEPEFPYECSDCQMLSINGQATHETGCPTYAKYRRELKRAENFECPGHGGITVSEPEEFETEAEAENNLASYHSRYFV